MEQEPAQEAEVQFIDLRTGLNTDGSVSKVDESGATSESAEQTSSPYRHAIAVSEQRDIREGYVRYIDHPTLQVVATWRELSFKEVYELGESQRIRRDIDSLTRTLTAAPNTTGPTPEGPRPRRPLSLWILVLRRFCRRVVDRVGGECDLGTIAINDL